MSILVPSNFRVFVALVGASVLLAGCEQLLAANQTPTVSPIQLNSTLPYKISVEPFDFDAAGLPTVHSYAAGIVDGKWVILAGRTNGLHGFTSVAANNFPPALDPAWSWSRWQSTN